MQCSQHQVIYFYILRIIVKFFNIDKCGSEHDFKIHKSDTHFCQYLLYLVKTAVERNNIQLQANNMVNLLY